MLGFMPTAVVTDGVAPLGGLKSDAEPAAESESLSYIIRVPPGLITGGTTSSGSYGAPTIDSSPLPMTGASGGTRDDANETTEESISQPSQPVAAGVDHTGDTTESTDESQQQQQQRRADRVLVMVQSQLPPPADPLDSPAVRERFLGLGSSQSAATEALAPATQAARPDLVLDEGSTDEEVTGWSDELKIGMEGRPVDIAYGRAASHVSDGPAAPP
jgi:hypothetical protein